MDDTMTLVRKQKKKNTRWATLPPAGVYNLKNLRMQEGR